MRDFKDILSGLDFYEVRGVTFDFGFEEFDVDFKKPFGIIGRRFALDSHLRRIAVNEGAELVKKNIIELPKTGTVIDARGFKAYSKSNEKKHRRMFIKFDFEGIGLGYYWIFPMKDGIVNVGIGGYPTSLKNHPFIMLERFCKDNGLRPYGLAAGNMHIDGKIENLIEGNVIHVGEGAGLVNPLTAEGVYQAMKSGEIAADCILKGKVDDYEKRIRGKFGLKFSVARKIRDWYFHNAPPKIRVSMFKFGMGIFKLYMDEWN